MSGSAGKSRRLPALVVVVAVVVLVAGGGSAAGSPSDLASGLPSQLPSSIGAAIYVSPTGSDRSTGTVRRPLRTIQAAVDRARPGQRVLIVRGTYPESVRVERSGTPSAPITIARFGPGSVVVRPPRTGRDTYAVEITASYIRVKGLVLEGASGTSSANVYVEDDASHVEIRGNEIRRGDDQGIFLETSTSNVQIIGNFVHTNGIGRERIHQSHGMYVRGTNQLIANNVVHDNAHGFGIQVYEGGNGIIVTGNTVAYNGLSGIIVGGDSMRNVIVRNNIVAFNARYGVSFVEDDQPIDTRVDTNLLWGNGWADIEPGYDGLAAADNVRAAPRFVSGRARDFRLTRQSRAVDAAVAPFATRVDVLGVDRRRGRGPDIGAYEWVPRR